MAADEITQFDQLVTLLKQMEEAVRMAVTNQEKFVQHLQKLDIEQQRAGKALGEIGVLLTAHAAFITEISNRLGLESVEDPAPQQPN